METKKFFTPVPDISIIIPVLHENGINVLIDHIKDISYGYRIEIIVSDGDAAGSTIKLIRDPSVITINSPLGRAIQMNKAAHIASSGVLLFLHADTFLPEKSLGLITDAMADAEFIGGAFDLGFNTDKLIFFLIAIGASIKHRLTRVPYGDQAIFIRREIFEKLGGYKEIPLMEDIDLMKRVKKAGLKIKIFRERVRTSHRKWQSDGVWYTIFRNWICQVRYLSGMSPEKLTGDYFIKKKNVLIIFFKIPEKNKVKTRLSCIIGEDHALELCKAMLKDTFENAHNTDSDIIASISGRYDRETGRYADCLHIDQRGSGLGERMYNAFQDAFNCGYKRCVLVGADCPDLTPEIINNAFKELETRGAVIGPSTDGGYYLIGFRRGALSPEIFSGIPWSTPEVLKSTIEKFSIVGKLFSMVDEIEDIDDYDDLVRFMSRNKRPSNTAEYLAENTDIIYEKKIRF